MKIFQIDAFAAELFQGNPAAVVPLEEWLPDETMQQIAMENNLAETAFIVKAPAGEIASGREDLSGKTSTDQANGAGAAEAGQTAGAGAYDYMIRWFTPTVEVELCGHATLASGHAVFRHLGFKGDVVVFRSLHSGDLKVMRKAGTAGETETVAGAGTGAAAEADNGREAAAGTETGGGREMLVLDFPANVPELAGTGVAAGVSEADRAAIFKGLKIAPRDLYRGRHDFMIVLDGQEDIEALSPDFKVLAGAKSRGVVVTAPGKEVDFVSRCFYPQSGIDEDPVTGSAHTMMIPYWAGRLGKNKLSAIQLSRRRGELDCTLAGDRVLIGGQAQTYLVGEIMVEESMAIRDEQKITIRDAQKMVDKWITTTGVRYFSELTNMAILTEEVGEVARLMSRLYGDQSFKESDKGKELADELADVLWVLICIANQTGVDLTAALEKNFEKKNIRDGERHKGNEKLR